MTGSPYRQDTILNLVSWDVEDYVLQSVMRGFILLQMIDALNIKISQQYD